MSVEDTEEEESSDRRKKGGRSSGKGSRGNWSESPSMTRQPYRARRGQETVWKALHQISHSPFSKDIERAHLPGKFSSPNYVMYSLPPKEFSNIFLCGQTFSFKQDLKNVFQLLTY
jgi:hypothetical protein